MNNLFYAIALEIVYYEAFRDSQFSLSRHDFAFELCRRDIKFLLTTYVRDNISTLIEMWNE